MLLVTAVGCAGSPRPVEPTASYFQDAGTCSRQSQDVTKVRVGVTAYGYEMPIELGLNQEKYKGCMESLGWEAPDPAKDPYFSLTSKCRQSSTRTTQASGGGLRLQTTVDETAYRECMRDNGVEGEVIVYPLESQ